MTTGTLLLVFVIGGGVVEKQWTSSLIPLKVTHPEFLVWLYCGVAVYAAWRYWYYAIEIPLTRTKIRHYLQSKESSLVIGTVDDRALQSTLSVALAPHLANVHRRYVRNLPLGLAEKEALLFTGVEVAESSPDVAKLTAATALAKYFPSLDANQISISDAIPEAPGKIYWASVSPSRAGTVIRCRIEDADLWAPVTLNLVGLALFIFSYFFCWPSALCVFGGK